MTGSQMSSSKNGAVYGGRRTETGAQSCEEGDDPGWSRDQAILRVVDRHVLPRLVCVAPLIKPPLYDAETQSERVAELTDFALTGDTEAARRMLVGLHLEGAGFSTLQLRLLMPAAVRLRWLWCRDEVSFVDVTVATLHLQQMMRFVSVQLAACERRPYNSRTILIAPAPGDMLGFRASMAAEFFRRDGWNVVYDPKPTHGSLIERVEGGWYDAVGFSGAMTRYVQQLRGTIAALRARSANKRILVIAGGSEIGARPAALDALGADAALAALDVAPARTHRLLNMRAAGRC